MMTTFSFVSTWLKARFTDSDRGAALVEYVLLVALIAVVCIAAINFLGENAEETFSDVGSELDSATN